MLLMLALVGARPALAQEGFNLSWDDCGVAGSATKTFACDNNDQTFALVVSVQTVSPINSVYYAGFDLDFKFDQPAPSSWWPLIGPASCRLGALNPTVLFPSSMNACARPPMPGFPMVIGNPSYPSPYITRVRIFVLTDQGFTGSFAPGIEIYLARVEIRTLKTVGAGACSGCGTGVGNAVNVVELIRLPAVGPRRYLFTPIHSGTVSWQGGSGHCAQSVEAKRPTWGAIKQLYH